MASSAELEGLMLGTGKPDIRPFELPSSSVAVDHALDALAKGFVCACTLGRADTRARSQRHRSHFAGPLRGTVSPAFSTEPPRAAHAPPCALGTLPGVQHRDALDALAHPGEVPPNGLRGPELLEHLLPFDELPKGGVLVVEGGQGPQADEELRASRVRGGGACHGQDAKLVASGVELRGQGVPGPAGAPLAHRGRVRPLQGAPWPVPGPGIRVPSLDDKSRNNPMKRQAVVKALPGKFWKLATVFGATSGQSSNSMVPAVVCMA
eukprot:CAMPEP_0206004254 /NCGR_PEP_ID=MMETSP1464-20131121/3862_1 /ASSEMBLY_ACC=CAM_ASM_001124 /TAXON_ID=119497 /ORGANISM="Exanthemachrysis gayraliae, Strain RCC1523" /LENGTH=264 /DNA_ID=CAMNT_0053377657 /DNA_START=516 /DNA_END=1307 /DNA_ORIENTATION=+